ncbi:hypothetical protein ACFQU2_42730 [Siccirubricoccus deserti]
MKQDGELWRRRRLRQVFLNTSSSKITAGNAWSDRAWLRRLYTARRTLAGYEVMAMVRKGQVRRIGGRDMQAQASFIA